MEKSGYQKRPESPFPVYFFFLCDSSVTLGNTLEKSGISPIERINHIVPSIIKKIENYLRVNQNSKALFAS